MRFVVFLFPTAAVKLITSMVASHRDAFAQRIQRGVPIFHQDHGGGVENLFANLYSLQSRHAASPVHRQGDGLNLTSGCAAFQLLIDGISETEIWAKSVEPSISRDYYRMTTIQSIRGRLEGVREVNMHPAEQFIKHDTVERG